GVLVEEDADAALPPEDLEGLGESLLPRKQAHAVALARALDEGVQGSAGERAEDDAELRQRDGAQHLEPRLALPEREVQGGEDDRAGTRRDLAGKRLGRGR